MAVSGSGTQADPYIVSSWAEFLTVVNTNNGYVKWADILDKTIYDTITISTSIQCALKYCNFNGWTFKRMDIAPANINNWNGAFAGKIEQAWNLHIEHLHFSSPKVGFRQHEAGGMNFTAYNWYLDKVTEDPLEDATDRWWQYNDLRYSNSCSSHFVEGPVFYYSQIYSETSNLGTRIPAGEYHFCNLKVKYTYDLQDGEAKQMYNDIFPKYARNAYVLSRFYNCYVYGKIDVSDGVGSFSVLNPAFSSGGGRAGTYVKDTIINLETIVGEDCTIKHVERQDNPSWLPDGKSYFVCNNGNNYDDYYTTASHNYDAAVLATISQIHNPDRYALDNFPFYYDDNVRHPKYGLDNNNKDWTWRWDANTNNSIAFLPFSDINDSPDPVEQAGDVYENAYICIFDMETKQDQFYGHGLAVLRPSSCRIVEELNGAYNLEMVHPVDAEGKWQYILEMNIIKALGQLFVIQKVDEVQQGGSRYVSCYAEHITYTLNDKWIFPPVTIAGYTGQTLIDNMLAQATDLGYDWQTTYSFTVTSDMSLPENFEDWTELAEGVTPYEMLLGGDGFVAKVGGELYRDNFTMKINERMYGAQDDAFEIAVGYNLTGIHRTVDLTTFCTYLRGYDVSLGEDYGDPYSMWWAIGWDPSTLPRPYPREVVRSKNFTFPDTLGEYRYDRLARATGAFFDSQCAPLITYELNIVDLKRNPDYSKFTNNYRYKVGDKGKVWDERLQSWVILEITRTEKDGITGDTTKVVIGTMRDFTRPVGYSPVIPRSTIIIPRTSKIIEGPPPIPFATSETQLEDWEIYGNSSRNMYPLFSTSSVYANQWSKQGITYNDSDVWSKQEATAWNGLCNVIELPVGTYTFSVYAKSASAAALSLYTKVPSEQSAYADYASGAATVNPTSDITITNGGTWQRYSITFNVETAGYVACRIESRDNVGLSVSCPQLESGSTATEYIPYGGVGEATVCPNIYPPIDNNSINHSYWGEWYTWERYLPDEPAYNTFRQYIGLGNEIYVDVGTWTFSVYMKAEYQLNNSARFIITEASDFPHYSQRATVSEATKAISTVQATYQRFTFTFNVTEAGYICPRIEKTDDSGTQIIVTCYQLESGSQATVYKPMGTTTYHIPVKVTGIVQTYYKTADDKQFADSTGALYLLADEQPYTIINIPIEAPLGANEVISRAETGIEIPTYNGQNVLSVETEVQPEKVKIWFKESI